MIEIRPTNVMSFDGITSWLADHGLDVNDVRTAVIRIDRGENDLIGAWLDATYYLQNEQGWRFEDVATGEAAQATATIPLKYWPLLTPVAPPAAA